MTVRRIVANIGTQDAAAAKRFYQDVLGLDVLMDQGWIVTYGSDETDAGADQLHGRKAAPARRCRICRSRSTMSMRRSTP